VTYYRRLDRGPELWLAAVLVLLSLAVLIVAGIRDGCRQRACEDRGGRVEGSDCLGCWRCSVDPAEGSR
jgi:hypothetical protein